MARLAESAPGAVTTHGPAGHGDRTASFDAAPSAAAVLGHPISHSLSPVLHREAYRVLGLKGWTYSRLDVDEERLADALKRVRTERSHGQVNWVGLSLTMPLKRAVRPLLDRESALAAAVGAVNTVTFTDTELIGDNTDVAGVTSALAEAGINQVESAVVLGGGATATSAVAALRQLGCASVTVHARRYGATEPLRRAADRLGVHVEVRGLTSNELARSAGCQVVVSTLPGAAADDLSGVLTQELLGVKSAAAPACLLDVVYAPWPTVLARHWSHGGGLVLGGLSMLVHQAAAQVRLMTGLSAPIEQMQVAGEKALSRRGSDLGK